ncbi:MAG: hypothetical protein KDC88_05955 [Ignavibacteriae bacterium]|nr:hypothetical protein [Ignavibacteriota bacterium]MCB9260268.1 hypothetical protein [Ignavibacteriales bacterium]
MKSKFSIVFLFTFIIFSSCNDNPVTTEKNNLEVNIRFEVKILDAEYKLYSVPLTKIYFTSYKLKENNTKIDFEQSDTTSCPNGWGVKELSFILNSEKDKIILGAACDNYAGSNYSQIEIDYTEAEVRKDSLGIANLNKTHIIYY